MKICQVLLFLGTILLATTTPSSSFLIINGTRIAQIRISGLLTCDVPPQQSPPPETRPILNGTNVGLQCGGSRKSIAEAVADVYGSYVLVYNTVGSFLFDPSDCIVIVQLPIALCFVYPPTGVLQATLTFVGLLQPLFNVIALYTAGPLELVT